MSILTTFTHDVEDQSPVSFQTINVFSSEYNVFSWENAYGLLYWSRVYSTLSKEDIRKIEDGNWDALRHCITLREKEIAWKFKHGALCTPKLAFQMGLVKENKCFFCGSLCPSWKHFLACSEFESMWNTVKSIISKVGYKWNRKFPFYGTNSRAFITTNHVLHAGYMVVYEYIIYEINNFKYKFQPQSRFKQLIFEMLYNNFKSNCDSEQGRLRFENYWQKLSFLFRITWQSIDIRVSE